MTERTIRADLVASGYVHGESQRKVVILLDDETFGEVRNRALKARTSFAAAARELIEFGLETAKEHGL